MKHHDIKMVTAWDGNLGYWNILGDYTPWKSFDQEQFYINPYTGR